MARRHLLRALVGDRRPGQSTRLTDSNLTVRHDEELIELVFVFPQDRREALPFGLEVACSHAQEDDAGMRLLLAEVD